MNISHTVLKTDRFVNFEILIYAPANGQFFPALFCNVFYSVVKVRGLKWEQGGSAPLLPFEPPAIV